MLEEQPPYCSSYFHTDISWEPTNPSFLPPSLHELVQKPNHAAAPGQETQAAIPTRGFWCSPPLFPLQQAEEQAARGAAACCTYLELSQPHLFVVAATARLQAACSCGLSSSLSHNIAFSSPWLKENKAAHIRLSHSPHPPPGIEVAFLNTPREGDLNFIWAALRSPALPPASPTPAAPGKRR